MSEVVAWPKLIQGGMGVSVSNWCLARTIACKGHLGVVSGTALDCVMIRRLQQGDLGGHVRRALEAFPFKAIARRVMERFFVRDGKGKDTPFENLSMPSLKMTAQRTELMVLGNFVEVFLAKEGHSHWIGINYLEKIQLPTLPSLFGAMLAGVNVVLMGAGIPIAIPRILDNLAQGKPVSLSIHVENNTEQQVFETTFDPAEICGGPAPTLERPKFFAIVSSDIVAKTMERRASGRVDGYILENHRAGGHNAPPRRDRSAKPGEPPCFGEKDLANLAKLRDLGKPFWLAGGYVSHERLLEALASGAEGIQLGTPFAFCEESGIAPDIKKAVVRQALSGELRVHTDFHASPTGYPFKVVTLANSQFSAGNAPEPCRICDLGYLRELYLNAEGQLGYRCPAEPEELFEQKGGDRNDCEGKICLCNGLMATAGLGQSRESGATLPLITAGEELLNLRDFVPAGQDYYTAGDVLDRILCPQGALVQPLTS